MKKDKVIIYDGCFINYESWNAPIIIDILGLDIQNPIPVTILGGYSVGTASAQRDATISEPQVTMLFADVDITKLDEFDQDMVANLKFACDIVVQNGGYVQPNTSFDVNGRTLTAGENGAWLITKSKLKAVTATPNDKPDWKIDHDMGQDRMNDMQEPTATQHIAENFRQCAQELQKANKTPKEEFNENPCHDDMSDKIERYNTIANEVNELNPQVIIVGTDSEAEQEAASLIRALCQIIERLRRVVDDAETDEQTKGNAIVMAKCPGNAGFRQASPKHGSPLSSSGDGSKGRSSETRR